jgi:hypothetical protein
VGVLALVAVGSVVLTILGGDYWGSPATSTVYLVACLALFGAAIVAMDLKTFVRISETGVDASQNVVWRDHIDWADVDRFEVSVFWTRSMVSAVNKDGSTFVALQPLDISWTEQKTTRTWRGYQADAVEVLNRALADMSGGV